MNILPKATDLFINIITFVSFTYNFSMAVNVVVDAPIQGTIDEK